VLQKRDPIGHPTLDAPPPMQGSKQNNIDCFCMFITIQQWIDRYSHRTISCLLLQQLPEKNVFTRLGKLVLDDLYALKMRYNVDVDEDRWKILQEDIADSQVEAINEAADEGLRAREAATNDITKLDEKLPEGLDALYQFDGILRGRENL
jgi:hypothetical protein